MPLDVNGLSYCLALVKKATFLNNNFVTKKYTMYLEQPDDQYITTEIQLF